MADQYTGSTAQYLTFLIPLSSNQQSMVSGSLVILVFLLLYRKIETIGRISVVMGVIVILTMLWIILSGFTHQQHSLELIPKAPESFFSFAFWAAVSHGSLKTVYSYLGYYNVCHLGSEIRNPGKNIPKSIFISIAGIAVLYLLMNIAVMGVIPWQEASAMDKYLVSNFMEKIYGGSAAILVTVLILCIALSSLFAVVLGYSRIPYAAAVDGNFFKPFAALHPTKQFPYISLIVLCTIGFCFSLIFRLSDVITAILAMRILIQFIAQAVGVVLLRRKNGKASLPFRMWAFPVPVVVSVAIWSFLFISTGWFAIYGLLIALAGVGIFFVKDRI